MQRGVVKEGNLRLGYIKRQRIRLATGQKREPWGNNSGMLREINNGEFLKGITLRKVTVTAQQTDSEISNRRGAAK